MIDINNPREILASKKCGDIFTNNPDKAKEEYKTLCKMYHPDKNSNELAEEVFKKINELYSKAEELFETAQWEISNTLIIKGKDGRKRTLKFLKECSFELGKQFIASTAIAYVINSGKQKYYDNMLKRIKELKYLNSDMEKEFSRYFPKVIDNFESTDGNWVIVISKTPDLIRLQDLLEYYKGEIPDRHVAWMISRLCNIVMYLGFSGIAHNGISLENCYVSPEYHSICLLGGWWYSVKHTEKMIGAPKAIYDIMTPKAKTEKTGSVTTDLESVKLIGRQALGNIKAPQSFMSWLNSGSSHSAATEYDKWDKALDNAYGERRFVKMEVNNKDVYNNIVDEK